jgi:hypothetical protein
MSTLYINSYCNIRAVTGNRQHRGFTEMWVSCQHLLLQTYVHEWICNVTASRFVMTQASLKERHFISYIFSSVGIAQLVQRRTRGWTTGVQFNSRHSTIFLFSTASRPTSGPTHPPLQWITRAISSWVKRPGREADHSPPSGPEVKGGAL